MVLVEVKVVMVVVIAKQIEYTIRYGQCLEIGWLSIVSPSRGHTGYLKPVNLWKFAACLPASHLPTSMYSHSRALATSPLVLTAAAGIKP